jgi:parvulin-like peptidyl-prolyl isomerase
VKKQMIAAALSGAMACTLLSGCVVNVANMGTVDGEELSVGMFNYYLMDSLSQFTSDNEISDYAAFEAFTKDGKTAAELVVDGAYERAAKTALVHRLCVENDCDVTQQEIDTYKTYLEQTYAQYGMSLDDLAGMMGMETDVFLESQVENLYYNKLQEKLYPSEEIADISDEEAKEIFMSDYVRVKNILFQTKDPSGQTTFTDAQIAEATDEANATLEKIRAGEDFESFLSLSDDPGTESQPDGYIFNQQDSYDAAFIEGSFALEVGEVSDLVESAYGYHIIKRYPLDDDPKYFEETKETIKSDAKNAATQEQYTANQQKLEEYLAPMIADIPVERNQSKIDKLDFKKLMGE